MNGQITMEFAEDVKLSELLRIVQGYATPEYILGYKEEYEIYRKKDSCIQLNVYYKEKIGGCEDVIKKGVYLHHEKDDYYTIAHFSSECLPAMVCYDGGKRDNGGRCPITDSTRFLQAFANHKWIYDDLKLKEMGRGNEHEKVH